MENLLCGFAPLRQVFSGCSGGTAIAATRSNPAPPDASKIPGSGRNDVPHRPGYGIAAALLIALIQGCAAPEVAKLPPIPLPEGHWELVSATFAEHGRIPG